MDTKTIRIIVFVTPVAVANGNTLTKLVIFSDDKDAPVIKDLSNHYAIVIKESKTIVPISNIASDSIAPLISDNRLRKEPREKGFNKSGLDSKQGLNDEGAESVEEFKATAVVEEDNDLSL